MSNDRYEKIRKALAMGPTPGPWVAGKNSMAVNFRFVTDRGGDVIAYCDRSKNEAMANACLISACDPGTIQALLEERDAAQAEARNWKRIAEDATHVEREELTRLSGLLGAARCPNCDGSGVIPHGPTSNGDWEVEQCQWCYEKQEALAAGGDQ